MPRPSGASSSLYDPVGEDIASVKLVGSFAEDLPDMSKNLATAFRSSFDDETGRTLRQLQNTGLFGISIYAADGVLRFRPWNMREEP